MGSLIPGAEQMLALLDEATERWHEAKERDGEIAGDQATILALILRLHRANFDLWHEEDQARDPDAADQRIAKVKHTIDGMNQRRNDLVETLDVSLCQHVVQNEDSPLHSETPGMIVDRLSIVSLKMYHTREETQRQSATEDQRVKNCGRLTVLTRQRSDLAGCLDDLMGAIERGERRFKVYRQMKMYNDPELNPVLYRRGRG